MKRENDQVRMFRAFLVDAAHPMDLSMLHRGGNKVCVMDVLRHSRFSSAIRDSDVRRYEVDVSGLDRSQLHLLVHEVVDWFRSMRKLDDAVAVRR